MADPVIAFCTPVYGQLYPEAAYAQQLAYHMAAEKNRVGMCTTSQMMVDKARNQLVRMALSGGATHLMWLDSDIVPPSDIVEKLLAHDVNIASGLYHYKDPPHGPVAYQLVRNQLPHGPQRLFADIIDHKILKGTPRYIDAVGMGAVLIKAQVFRDLKDPWFRSGLEESEDLYFFRRYNGLGAPKVLLDPSVRCGHITTKVITTDDWPW